MSRKEMGWTWILTLFSAGGIPVAVVTFVSLIIFVQCGFSYSLSSLLYALLFIPSVMKSILRPTCVTTIGCKRQILSVQSFLVVVHVLLAMGLVFSEDGRALLVLLMLLSAILCACHELLVDNYYGKVLTHGGQRVWRGVRMFATLAAQVLTYGLLIVIAGNFQWYFRYMEHTVPYSWAFVLGLVSLTILVCLLANMKLLVKGEASVVSEGERNMVQMRLVDLKSKLHTIWSKRTPLAICFLMLLPQSLLFATRVFFLLSSKKDGGLECSLMDVGFAQGAVGVIAFSFGIVLGHFIVRRYGWKRSFPPLAVVLGISPLFYYLMASNPVHYSLMAVCMMTFFSQLCFGVGINSCQKIAEQMSGRKYSSTVSVLNMPLVALAMILPVALSGVLLGCLGYERFFALCVITSIFPIIVSKAKI